MRERERERERELKLILMCVSALEHVGFMAIGGMNIFTVTHHHSQFQGPQLTRHSQQLDGCFREQTLLMTTVAAERWMGGRHTECTDIQLTE